MKFKPIICIPKNDNIKRFLLGKKGTKTLLAIALNPSTANENILDPTSRNIEKLAIQNKCDGWYLVNLYPLRTSKPRNLPKTHDRDLMNDNFKFIDGLLSSKEYGITKVLFCWGNEVDSHDYLKESARKLTSIVKENKLTSYYMKLTGAGNPFHPAPTPVNRWLGGISNVKLSPYKK